MSYRIDVLFMNFNRVSHVNPLHIGIDRQTNERTEKGINNNKNLSRYYDSQCWVEPSENKNKRKVKKGNCEFFNFCSINTIVLILSQIFFVGPIPQLSLFYVAVVYHGEANLYPIKPKLTWG